MEKTRNFRHYTFKEMERICLEYHQKFQTSPSMEYMVAQLNTRYNKTCRNKEWTKQALYNFLSKGKKSGEIENYVVHLSNWDFLNPAYQPPVHEDKNESLIPEKDLGKTKIIGKTDLEVEEEMRELKLKDLDKVDPKDIGETKVEVVDPEDIGETDLDVEVKEEKEVEDDIGETDLDVEEEEEEEEEEEKSEESDLGVEVISSDSDDWEMEILDTYSFQ